MGIHASIGGGEEPRTQGNIPGAGEGSERRPRGPGMQPGEPTAPKSSCLIVRALKVFLLLSTDKTSPDPF